LGRSEAAEIARATDVIVHAAANTSFSATEAALFRDNVGGTTHVLELASQCARLSHVVLVSTASVAGTRTGEIREQIEPERPAVVTAYEDSKWQAEQAAASSGVPVRIARVGTCIGDGRSGYVHRIGALHQSLRWLARGLVPMVPGLADSRLDLISTDFAARWLARAASTPVRGIEVCHVTAGRSAAPLDELLRFAVEHINETRGRSGRRRIEMPVIVDAESFAMFHRLVAGTGDPVFRRVLQATASFFPVLLYPKRYTTREAERVWGGPFPDVDWRPMLARVIDFVLARRSSVPRELVHA
jgi:nucleoside-diphosphate-sugar epimerase